MNIDEAAQYLGYRDAEHLEMNDISDCSKWWELIKKLVETKAKNNESLHLVSCSDNKYCEDCGDYVKKGCDNKQCNYYKGCN